MSVSPLVWYGSRADFISFAWCGLLSHCAFLQADCDVIETTRVTIIAPVVQKATEVGTEHRPRKETHFENLLACVHVVDILNVKRSSFSVCYTIF